MENNDLSLLSLALQSCICLAAFIAAGGTVWAAWIARRSAGAAERSASGAESAAKETSKAAQAQLLASLLDSYARPEFSDAIRELKDWKRVQETRFAEKFRQLKIDDYDQVAKVDNARRLLAHYFQKVWALHSLGYISEAVVKQAVSENQANLLQEYVDPLDWANNQSSFEANQAYTYLLGLYELKRWSPPIA